ncbi:hypothetical protein NDU88_005832 [Pleurodeles waltl]|uniref:Uncharacterized protein n=1 Tax=Pleurodeles waltl TaxID=8319 RepID=A0AAV7MXK3_PLEWA|nr:hypothetical protein NDU88_005832 [Pleurodeles waltl]
MPRPPSFPNRSPAMSVFRTSVRRYMSLPRRLELASLFMCSTANALKFSAILFQRVGEVARNTDAGKKIKGATRWSRSWGRREAG